MKSILITFSLLMCMNMSAQKYFTKTGLITFHSDAPMEKIEAENHKATSVIDMESGEMQWSVLIKAFAFEKSLMEEHFNENYMESSKFPKATFKGAILNLSDLDLSIPGTYTVKVKGTLQIHGVSQEVETEASFIVRDEDFSGNAEFEVALADYDIEIPSVVAENIAKTVLIKVNADYQKLER